jgi:uncharacterized RDD family membrane protein YckC
MSSPQITLQTVTGVDVELTIAGPGSRSYAFIIDWHIRLLLALQWILVGHLIYFGGFRMASEPGWRLFEVLKSQGLQMLGALIPVRKAAPVADAEHGGMQ